jgi:hypothetical protein
MSRASSLPASSVGCAKNKEVEKQGAVMAYKAVTHWQEEKGVLIARMHEISEFSGGGVACVIFLILSFTITFFGVMAANNAIQQAATAVIGMSAIITFGIGAIIGRRKTYYIHRQPFEQDTQK